MNSRTLILVHPQQKRTLQNKIFINQELNNLIRQKRIKNFTLKTYNRQLRNEIKKFIFFKILNNPFSFFRDLISINVHDVHNIKFLYTQLQFWIKMWGHYELRYFCIFKAYVKYPAILRFIYLFFYTKIKSELLQTWIGQYNKFITVCYYDRSMLPFVLGFRKQNKEVWDIQHGSINPGHFAYNNKLFKINSGLGPTGIFIFQKSALTFLNKKNIQIKYIKKPKTNKKNNKQILLVTLQWGCKLPKIVSDFLKLIKNKKVLLRMHPREFDSISKKFEDPSFADFLKTSKNISSQNGLTPIESVLNSTFLHFTENSSVTHEAAERKIISYFWCKRLGKKMFQREIKMGLARQVKTSDDLTRIIEKYNI
jgi:hypothetical protein